MKHKLTIGDIICYPVIFNPFYLLIIVAITLLSIYADLFETETIHEEKFVKLNLTKGRILLLELLEAIIVGVVNLYFWNDLLAYDYAENMTKDLYPQKYQNKK